MTIRQKRRFGVYLAISFVSAVITVLVSGMANRLLWELYFALNIVFIWFYQVREIAYLDRVLELARREHERHRVEVIAQLETVRDEGLKLLTMGRKFEEDRAAVLAKVKPELDRLTAAAEATIQTIQRNEQQLDTTREQARHALEQATQLLHEIKGRFELPGLEPPKKPGPAQC